MTANPAETDANPAAPRRWAIGIDVGGTKIAGGLLDAESGETRFARTIPTRPERGGEAVLADAVALAEALAAKAEAEGCAVHSVGIGVAELVDPSGRVASAQTIGWAGTDIAAAFAHLAPARAEADVRAAALAEGRFGAGQGMGLWAYVTVGTGIASTIVVEGKPLAGARGNALVLATGPVSLPCPGCGSLATVAIEEVASGPAIARRYRDATGYPVDRAEGVICSADAGNHAARAIVDSAAVALGSAIGWLVNVVDPEAVVVGGGLGSAGGRWWDRVVAATRAHVWAEETRSLPLLPAALGPSSGWIGAALAGAGAAGPADCE